MSTCFIPRVVCPHPLCCDIPDGQPTPIRARDDLDPYAPPLEYADGRVLWSGYPTREARDAGRIEEARRETEEAAQRREKQRRLAEQERIRRQHAAVEARRLCGRSGHRVARESEPRPYMSSVATPFITEECPAAAGNISVVETCSCGAERYVNLNGQFREESAWNILVPVSAED